jgi:hypothetical protein
MLVEAKFEARNRKFKTSSKPECCKLAAAALWLLSSAIGASAWAEPLAFEVRLDERVADRPITGRLLVFLSQRNKEEPRMGPDWFQPEPFFGVDVHDFAPGERRTVDDQADAFPEKLSKLPAGKYRVQAVLDHSLDEQHHGKAAGNFYTPVVELDLSSESGIQTLVLSETIAREPFPESKWVHEVTLRSELLSKFHGRDVDMRCAVVLPASYYDQPERRYPIVYIIPGFTGTHRGALRYVNEPPPAGDGEVEFLRVMLNPDCQWGHHVFADSTTNGPRGESLIKELIPHLDQNYRSVAAPQARFLNGHSSGGWSSLWLQVSYPETFGGVWSTSPDPVSFHDYQQVDLYAYPPLSLYYDEQGQRRPIARRGRDPVLWYESFGRMDDCLGRGGQLRSFEAVFSPLGDDGLPRKLWHRRTGRINPEVARAWQRYDIRLKLQENWAELEAKLRGKLHVTVGSLDTFYLDGAVALLAETLKKLGSDAEITILAGESHSSFLTPEFFQKTRRQMSARYLSQQKSPSQAR